MYTLNMLIEQLKSALISVGKILSHDYVTSVRIACKEEMQPQILYLTSLSDGDSTLCYTKHGSSFQYQASVSETMNQMLEIMDYYRRWENEMQKASRSGCTLTELLDLAYPVIAHPIFILDRNEWLIASTSAIEKMDLSRNEDLSDLMRFRSSTSQKIAAFNQKYPDVFSRTDVYSVPGNIFSAKNGYAMNLFHRKQLRGIMLIDSLDTPITQGKLDLFFQLGLLLRNMLNDPSSGLSIGPEEDDFISYLRDSSEENRNKLTRMLELLSWKKEDEKQLVFIKPAYGEGLSPNLNHALLMFNRLFGLRAAEYRNGILLFLNRNILNERSAYLSVIERIRQLSYCAGISNAFTEIDRLPAMAYRAYRALESGDQSVGAINRFEDHYLRYFFSLIEEEDRELLVHPLLKKLKEYDRRFGSSLYQTLFIYLKNERKIIKTMEEMKIHRSTLLHRLNRIDELSDGILEQPEYRMQLLLSFYMEQSDRENGSYTYFADHSAK